MTVIGADPDQLRATANQFVQAADRLEGSLKGLNSFVSNATIWRGPDSERFRSEWNGQSVSALNGAITALREGAEVLRRNADEQDNASRADGGTGSQSSVKAAALCYEPAPTSLSGMWNEVQDISKESSGYRVQKIIGDDGVERYIVYIAGTNAAEGQTGLDAMWAAQGRLDDDELAALEGLIPEGAEVMLVGYSQGGMDAQNIAASGRLNVQQVVTFGSPVRGDLDVPAIHLQADGDGIPGSAAGMPGPYFESATAIEDNSSVFSGASDIGRTGFNAGAIHANGYGGLSEEWDNAASQGTDARAAEAAGGLSKFGGDVVGQVDIDTKGHGSW